MKDDIIQVGVLYKTIVEFVVNYSMQIIGAVVIFLLGAWIAGKVGKFIESLMIGREIDITLSRFSGSTVKLVVLVMVGMIALGNLGISVTPLIAAVGALGLGLGLAIQGMLANYAAGFTIIITRPFVVGDTISVQAVIGVVSEVQLGYTYLLDEDGVRIQIPNRHIVGEIIHNSANNLLIELQVGVAYSSEPDKVIEIIQQALSTLEEIDNSQAPLIGIDSFGDSGINFGIRFLAPTKYHYDVKYRANHLVFNALREAGIEIPFPQREVKLLNGQA